MRKPAVAGQFYPAEADKIKKQLAPWMASAGKKEKARGAIMPHAGYIYSGVVAAAVASAVELKSNYVILGPNHTGMGTPFSLMSSEDWMSPLGRVEVNKELAGQILKNSKLIKEDNRAHAYEHSIEVQLPFLQLLSKEEFKFVPIIVASTDLQVLKGVGQELAQAIRELKLEEDTLIIASSDMTHYESQASAESKDKQAIDAILNLDEDLLFKRVRDLDISMCGFAPAIIMLSAVKALGAKKARLVKYQTSAQVSQDYDAVVGYAGIIVS